MWQVLHNLAQCHGARCRPDADKSTGDAKKKENQCEYVDADVDVDVDTLHT